MLNPRSFIRKLAAHSGNAYVAFVRWIVAVWVSVWGLFSGPMAYGQCATCKAAAASKDASGDLVVGAGLNSAILYLLSMPFLISAIIGIIWYTRRRQLEKGADSA